MGKGILGMAREILRDKKKDRQKDFERRRDLFFEEYKLLAEKYKCDWNPYIKTDKFGQKATPHLDIIDATEYLEDEEKKEEEENNKLKEKE